MDLDAVKQLLKNAIENLGDLETARDLSLSVLNDQLPTAAVSQTPIVIVLASDSNKVQPVKMPVLRGSDEPIRTDSSGCGCNERKVSHPGLERFTIDTGATTSVPKPCFMEPDRICVNSGACEMRGF